MNGKSPRILIVEDEWLIADAIATMLRADGFEVVGPLATVQDACAAIQESAPDAAVLDISLGDGDTSYPIARRLAELEVPFAFMSGYSHVQIPTEFKHVPLASKPVSLRTLFDTVNELLRG